MTSYTNLFGGTPIYPSRTSYVSLSMTGNVTLGWGFEGTTDVVADIMNVSSDAARDLTMPSALKAAPGTTVLIINGGSYTITVKDNGGSSIASVTAGSSYFIYLKTNATAAGTWGSIEYGAVTAGVQAADLDGSGLVALSNTLNLKAEVSEFSATTTAGLSDRAKVLTWTGGSGTLNLPAASSMTDSWFIYVKNAGSGTLTVTPASGNIDGAASLSVAQYESFAVVHNGTDYFTIGRGRTLSSSTDYISINVAGSGDYTLSSGQQGKVIYNFTGLLTGNRNIIVPASVAEYWVANDTTGAYTLTVKTAAGTGQTVTQGQQAILYCDGTNVEAATSTITTPVAIVDGGTGAASASAARTNLGASSIGSTIFTAADEAAVRTALSLTVGTDVQAYDADLAALAANSTNGLWARTGAGTGAARTITAPAAGITVSNGDGVSGNPTLALANDLSALEGLSGTGVAVRTGTSTWTNRTITGTANEITVTNGDGVSGAPTLSLPSALTFTGKTVTGGTLAAPTVTNYTETVSSSTGSTTINLSNGTIFIVTTNGTNTITLPSSVAGKSFVVIVSYGGSHSISWAGGSTIKWDSGITPTPTSTSGKRDIFTFFQDGTNTYGAVFGQNF